MRGFVIWLLLLATSAGGQTLLDPEVTMTGEPQQAAHQAVTEALQRIFPSQRSPQQQLAYNRVLNRAANWVQVPPKRNKRYSVTIAMPALFDAINASGVLSNHLKNLPLHLVDASSGAPWLRGFLLERGFVIKRLNHDEIAEFRRILGQKHWRQQLITALSASGGELLINITATAGGEQFSVYNANGREFTIFSTPLPRQTELSQIYQIETRQLAGYKLFAELVRQILHWQVNAEYYVRCCGFPASLCREALPKLRRELGLLKGVDWISDPSHDHDQYSFDFTYNRSPTNADIGAWIGQRLQAEVGFFHDIDQRQNRRRIVVDYRFSEPGWATLAAIAIVVVAVGYCLAIRRRKNRPGDSTQSSVVANRSSACHRAAQQSVAADSSNHHHEVGAGYYDGKSRSDDVSQQMAPGEPDPILHGQLWNLNLLDNLSERDQKSWSLGKVFCTVSNHHGQGKWQRHKISFPSASSPGVYPHIKTIEKDKLGSYYLSVDSEQQLCVVRSYPITNPKISPANSPKWNDMLKRIKTRGENQKLVAIWKDLQNLIVVPDQFVERNGKLLAIMPYYPGITLRRLLMLHGKLTWRQARPFLWQTVRILQELHCRGIVHRDIKPEHILCCLQGNCRITGVALARIAADNDDSCGEETLPVEIESEEDNPELTLPDKGLGSPAYAAPEQLQNAVDVSNAVDRWSYAVTCIHVLTGTVPFTGGRDKCRKQVLSFDNQKHFAEWKKKLREQGVPHDFIQLIRNCLHRNPAQRPGLDKILQGAK